MFIQGDIINIDEHVKSAKREGLVFNPNTKLYLLIDGATLVGFTGIQKIGKKYVFKNHYVLPKYRGRGYFKQMLDFSLNKTKGYLIEATCTNMSIREYIKRGFRAIRQYKKYTKMQYENI